MPNLTEQEKQEILRFIETDKPLSVFHEYPDAGTKATRRKIAVKVVDIFGNDTMTIVEVNG